MSKKKLNIPLSEFINLNEKKPEDMNGGLDVATWHSHAYNPDDEPGYFKQGCFYMGKENIVAWLSINDYVIDMNDSES